MTNTTMNGRAFFGATALICVGAAAGPAPAINGYFANGHGTDSRGMAGAGPAVPSGVLGLAQNPAMGRKAGDSAEVCPSMFSPDRSALVSRATRL